MSRDAVALFDGKIQASRVGQFTRCGVDFDIVRPGYDAQGRRRIAWTQFVVQGVPVYEVKKRAELDAALDQFDDLWETHIKDDVKLLKRALEAARAERLARFRDGFTGESPAPALTQDGRSEGKSYPA